VSIHVYRHDGLRFLLGYALTHQHSHFWIPAITILLGREVCDD
jgi:hypothetical protein